MGHDTDWDEVWRGIDTARLRVADLLDGLSPDEWARPSLCAGWTVRDVAAHLTLQELRPGRLVVELARSPRILAGGMNGMIRDVARRHARRPTADLTADIRATIGSRRHNFGVTPLETLIDILVHGQDIALPLGRRLEATPAHAALAASRVWHLRGPFHARTKMRGFRLTATDTTWTAGDGEPVEGPMIDLLLVLTGRFTTLDHLTGAGAPALTARLAG